MAVLALLLFVAGIGVLGGAGVLLVRTTNEYGGCVDECHGAFFYGLEVLVVFMLGLLLLLTAAVILTQHNRRRSEEIDRELRALTSGAARRRSAGR